MRRFCVLLIAFLLATGLTGCKKDTTGLSETEVFGFEVAFVGESRDFLHRNAYLYSSIGNELKRLTPDSLLLTYNLEWSADGSRLFFISTHTQGSFRQLLSYNLNGTISTLLDTLFNSYGFTSSPDSRYIIYSQDGKIFKLDLGTNTQAEIAIPATHVSHFFWSSDGTKILFDGRTDSRLELIAAINPDGSGFDTLITANWPDHISLNDRSPIGGQIAYTRQNNIEISDSLIVFDIATKQELFRVEGHSAKWSPDARYISYIKDEGLLRYTWVMNADGTNAQKLTLPYSILSRHVWLPDSRHLLYLAAPLPNSKCLLVSIDIRDGEISELYELSNIYPYLPDVDLAVRPFH